MQKSILVLVLFICFTFFADGRYIKRRHIFERQLSKQSREGSSDPVVNRRLAGIARQILRQSKWGDMAVLSAYVDTLSYPFASPKIFAEGNSTVSTGRPYFYLSSDFVVSEFIRRNTKMSFTVTMEQNGFCSMRDLDVQSPHCYFIVYTGNFIAIEKGTKEYNEAYQYLREKYPSIEKIRDKSMYFIGTVKLIDVMIVAGKKLECIPLDTYFDTPPNEHFDKEIEEFLG